MTDKDPAEMTQDEAIQALGEAGDVHLQALVARMMLNSGNERNHILQQLVGSFQDEVAELQVTLHLVRQDILEALNGRYMPVPEVIRAYLYPSKARIEAGVKVKKLLDRRAPKEQEIP